MNRGAVGRQLFFLRQLVRWKLYLRRMNKWIHLILLIAFSAAAQEPLKPVSEMTAAADDYVGFDPFGYYYLVRGNTLVKTNGNGSVEYQDVRLGRITRVDVLNPLLLVLFYEPFNTVVLLDNQLNEISRINFTERSNPLLVHAAGLAGQNRLWLFESLSQQVLLYDYTQDKIAPIGTPLKEPFIYYETNFNQFVWIEPTLNAYSMDVFGKVTSLGTVPQHRIIRSAGNGWIYYDSGKITYFDSAKNMARELMDVGKTLKNFYYKDQILSIFTSQRITDFNFKTP